MERRSHRSLAKKGRLDEGSPEKETWEHFVETQQKGGDGTARTRREEARTQVSEGTAEERRLCKGRRPGPKADREAD